MSVLYIALPIALLVAFASVMAFIWSVNTGQLDDLETPAVRILQDDAQTPGHVQKADLPNGPPGQSDLPAEDHGGA